MKIRLQCEGGCEEHLDLDVPLPSEFEKEILDFKAQHGSLHTVMMGPPGPDDRSSSGYASEIVRHCLGAKTTECQRDTGQIRGMSRLREDLRQHEPLAEAQTQGRVRTTYPLKIINN